ncbi:MAG TPA: dTDP-4-dehydrorhamnose reductase [Bacteroidales bacterium]|nr:dTDP-4-dehydrorhamnose reductase [Bacteroidales bacterium]HQK37317.1 dTDP-4-dehydrorhamnose reductase [Bacteroidales bacterium]
MKKVLITGSNGQLGNELRRLLQGDSSVRFLFTDLPELDITLPAAVNQYIEENRPDIIVNCAAYTQVDKAESEPEIAFRVNTEGVKILAQEALRTGAAFLHISTDFVFDGSKSTPYSENDKPNPLSVYGKSKLEGEKYALEAGMVIRTSWLYSSFGQNFVKTILRLAKEKDEIRVVFDQTGTPTFAGDLAQVILAFIYRHFALNTLPKREIFHFSNEGVCSWYDFAHEIVQLAQLPCRVSPIETHQYPLPARRPPYSVLNKHKIRQYLGISIPHWTESLRTYLKKLH